MAMVEVVIIEGPIAAGKTTVLDHIEDCNLPGVLVVREPVDDWQGASMLQAMYDGSLPMCTFQLTALATRVAALHKALTAEPPPVMVVAERSVYSDRLFAIANLDRTSVAADAYNVAWNALVPLLPAHTVFHIMLQCPVPTLLKRMAARGRREEALITAEYMDTINALHEGWAVSAPDCNVVDASRCAVAVAASVAAIVIERRGLL